MTKRKRGRPRKDFETEEELPYFFCQFCGIQTDEAAENWVRYHGVVVRICNGCYETYDPIDAAPIDSE